MRIIPRRAITKRTVRREGFKPQRSTPKAQTSWGTKFTNILGVRVSQVYIQIKLVYEISKYIQQSTHVEDPRFKNYIDMPRLTLYTNLILLFLAFPSFTISSPPHTRPSLSPTFLSMDAFSLMPTYLSTPIHSLTMKCFLASHLLSSKVFLLDCSLC